MYCSALLMYVPYIMFAVSNGANQLMPHVSINFLTRGMSIRSFLVDYSPNYLGLCQTSANRTNM